MLNLLYEASKVAKIQVKTPNGLTEVREIYNIILQGETFSSLLCTSSLDLMSKECELPTYMYRNILKIPKLSFVDDSCDISYCGKSTQVLNSYTRKEVNTRKLQFADDKCHRLHISKGKATQKCSEIYIDKWTYKNFENNGENISKDIYEGVSPISSVSMQEYLGICISKDGKNTLTINAKVAKGQGIINDIFSILESVYFGDYYFEAAILLRNSLLLSVILHNTEILYNLTNYDIKRLEDLDYQVIRRCLGTTSKCSKAILLLEIGAVPLKFIIKKNRIIYCHKLLTSDDKNLAKLVLEHQIKSPMKNDSVISIR